MIFRFNIVPPLYREGFIRNFQRLDRDELPGVKMVDLTDLVFILRLGGREKPTAVLGLLRLQNPTTVQLHMIKKMSFTGQQNVLDHLDLIIRSEMITLAKEIHLGL